ncbi:MAG: hypothetical protein NT144_01450 [Bacteroidia bacterium]|nr:hypothetical protein [Bacteroidia bacterium]
MVYKFVVLSDEDESFVREFEFFDSHTLMDFHNLIQDELEFDKSQMASFFLATDNWEKEEEFTLFDMGTGSSTMEVAVLEDIIFRKNQKLLYVFDFFNEFSVEAHASFITILLFPKMRMRMNLKLMISSLMVMMKKPCPISKTQIT